MSGESAYVSELADTIGPRPATTDAEARAAGWITEVFAAKGLEVSTQEIEVPRSDSWGRFITAVLTIVAAAAAGFALARWPALVVALAAAILYTLDLSDRFSLSSILPKGPSQNVIAKHVPHARRNEKLRRIVVLANLDSARPSLVTNSALVRSVNVLALVTLAHAWLVVVLTGLAPLPVAATWQPWLWYVTLVVAAWALFPIVVTLHRELVMKASPGANTNASGVAAMLGVLDRLVPEKSDVVVHAALAEEPVRQGKEVVWGAELVPEDSLLSYSPASAPDRRAMVVEEPGGDWAASDPGRGQGAFEGLSQGRGEPTPPIVPDLPPRPPRQALFDDEDLEIDMFAQPTGGRTRPVGETRPAGETLDVSADIEAPGAPASGGKDKEKGGVFGWLGVDRDWDARKKGAEIGSWEKFDEEEEDHPEGFKGGEVPEQQHLPADRQRDTGEHRLPLDRQRDTGEHRLSGDRQRDTGEHRLPIDRQHETGSHRLAIEDPGFATDEVARIRRQVTTGVDRELSEKEIWFVATGAGEIGAWGARHFIREYGDELTDALFVGLYSVGDGTLAYVSDEGGALGKKHADRRMFAAARRVARDLELPMKSKTSSWGLTDIGRVLRGGLRGMSIMAFDINGRLGNWRSLSDTSDAVSEANVAAAADFVTAFIREL